MSPAAEQQQTGDGDTGSDAHDQVQAEVIGTLPRWSLSPAMQFLPAAEDRSRSETGRARADA
jgi:hypothetical protein